MDKPLNDKVKEVIRKTRNKNTQVDDALYDAQNSHSTKKAVEHIKRASKTLKETIETLDDMSKVLSED